MSDEDFKNLVSNKCPTSCRGLPALFIFAELLLLKPGNIVKGGDLKSCKNRFITVGRYETNN